LPIIAGDNILHITDMVLEIMVIISGHTKPSSDDYDDDYNDDCELMP